MKVFGGVDALARSRVLRRWIAVADRANRMDPATLGALRDAASQDRAVLDRAIERIDDRLSGPVLPSEPEAPRDSDWIWRPATFTTRMPVPGYAGIDSGTALGDGARLFHDCALSEITVRQSSARTYSGTAPFGLDVDVLNFNGSFLSFVVELPDASVAGLTLNHVVHVTLRIEAERPMEIFTRLNVKHGPNTEQIVREVDMRHAAPEMEFDLAYTEIAEPRIERAWIDIIFGDPRMNRVSLRDMVVSRRLRAEM